MSVNLHLLLKVGGYHPSQATAIMQALQAVLVDEQISSDMSPLAESGEGASRAIFARSKPEQPMTISGAHTWLPNVKGLLSKAAEGANGGACTVVFEGWNADEPDANTAASDYIHTLDMRPLKPSAELAAIVGVTPMIRTDVVTKLWEYIKANNLQNPEKKSIILCDAKLSALLGKPEVPLFELDGLAAKHLS
jgi:hypothetical protein